MCSCKPRHCRTTLSGLNVIHIWFAVQRIEDSLQSTQEMPSSSLVVTCLATVASVKDFQASASSGSGAAQHGEDVKELVT